MVAAYSAQGRLRTRVSELSLRLPGPHPSLAGETWITTGLPASGHGCRGRLPVARTPGRDRSGGAAAVVALSLVLQPVLRSAALQLKPGAAELEGLIGCGRNHRRTALLARLLRSETEGSGKQPEGRAVKFYFDIEIVSYVSQWDGQ